MTPDEVVETHCELLRKLSDEARSSIECQVGVVYGDGEEQKMDIFAPSSLPSDAPIFVYIHGGYWQMLSLADSSFMANTFTKAGAVVVAVGYDLAPKATMDEIVTQVKRAVVSVMKYAKKRNSSGIYLCGHSAGGHLAAMMLSQDWMGEFMESGSLIKGAFLVSGIFDLRPIILTTVNNPLQMVESDAWRNSPMNYVSSVAEKCKKCSIVIAVGEHDSPAFREQSLQYQKALEAQGLSPIYMVLPQKDHFDVIEGLNDPAFSLTRVFLEQMKLV